MASRALAVLSLVPLSLVMTACSSGGPSDPARETVATGAAGVAGGADDRPASSFCELPTVEAPTPHSSPVIAARHGGSLDLLYNGPDTSVRHRVLASDGASWSAEENLGGYTLAKPGVAAWGFRDTDEDRLDVFSPGGDRTMWHRWWVPNGGRWEGLGGDLRSAVAVSSWGSGRLDMSYIGSDGALRHRYYWGGWHADEVLGGSLIGDPTSVSWAPERLDLFARSADNQLWHRYYDRGWANEELLGGNLASSPTVASWGLGRMDVFWRGAGDSLKHMAFAAGSWHSEEDLGGAISGDPAATSSAFQRVDLVTADLDGKKFERRQFSGVGDVLTAADCADPSLRANVVVAVETKDGSAVACSGVLLTPTTVLTARPCAAPSRVGEFPTVRVGATFASAKRYHSIRKPTIQVDPTRTSHSAAEEPGSLDTNEQLALIYLDPRTPVLEDAIIAHPALTAPVTTSDAPDQDGAWAFANVGISGWSSMRVAGSAGTRQVAKFDSIPLVFNTDYAPDNPFWVRNSSTGAGGLDDVDLGGALFTESTNGDRAVFGIAIATGKTPSQMNSGACPATAIRCDAWVDITSATNLDWIRQNVEIPLRATGATKNAQWFASHPKSTDVRADGTPDWWVGEVDYTGPCESTNDADCDHWLDTQPGSSPPLPRDNCRGWWNPDQGDADDDGFGNVCDNCAGRYNPAQSNSSLAFKNQAYGAVTPPPRGMAAEISDTVGAIYPGDGCRQWSGFETTPTWFNGIWAADESNAWAVGSYGSAWHWDGSDWTPTASTANDILQAVWGSGPRDVWAVGARAKIAHFDGTKWSDSPLSTSVSAAVTFKSVWGTTANDVWAVGNAENTGNHTYRDAVMHWDGSTWTFKNVGLTDMDDFYAVWGSGPSDVWAGGNQKLAHWDGAQWAYSTIAGVGANGKDLYNVTISGIWGAAVNDVWAVGSSSTGALIAHWNGLGWTKVSAPAGAAINGIAGRAANDVWATGQGSLAHWDGATWQSQVTDTTDSLGAIVARADGLWMTGGGATTIWRRKDLQSVRTVAAAGGAVSAISQMSRDEVFAFGASGSVTFTTATSVGTQSTGSTAYIDGSWATRDGAKAEAWAVGAGGAALHFNGASWSAVSTGTTRPLHGIGGSTPSDLWAVGDAGTLLHYDGAQWRSMLAPSGTTSSIQRVWASAPSDAWAVGGSDVMLHWEGTGWSSVPTGTSRSYYRALAGTSAHDVWAGGASGLLLHWDGQGWLAFPSGVTGEDDDIFGLAALATNDVWAVTPHHVLRFDGSRWQTVGVEPLKTLTAISAADSSIWVASDDGLLRKLK